MSLLSLFSFLLLFTSLNAVPFIEAESDINDTPIIGILAQELSDFLHGKYPEYGSYISSAYIKFIESAGARAVPIMIGKDRLYYEDLMSKLNGVLFPGGIAPFDQPKGYADAGEIIYDIAKKYNDNGDYFPLFGTCLGFQLLTYLSANRSELRADCFAQEVSYPLDFTDDYQTSKMFKDASTNIGTILSQEPVTANFHKFCVTRENLTHFGIDDEWRVISLNNDENGFNFISTIESNNYPFYGVQYHPEKNIFEWFKKKNIIHTKGAVVGNRFFADFLISEARKSLHHFENETEEAHTLIYNYQPTYTAINGIGYELCYFF